MKMTDVNGIPLTMRRQAYTNYYYCQKINPDNKLNLPETSSWGIGG